MMGYYLNSFVGRQERLEKLALQFTSAKVVSLKQGVALVPMTGELFNEINNYRVNNDLKGWEFLTKDVEREILGKIGSDMIAYIEVEFFGGVGGQTGVIWKDGKRVYEEYSKKNVVNSILQQFGVVKDKSSWDEFDSVGLGQHRDTDDWVRNILRK